MAHQKFAALRLTDAQTFDAFEKIAAAMGQTEADIRIQMGERFPDVREQLSNYRKSPFIRELLQSDTAAASRLYLNMQSMASSVHVVRDEKDVHVEIHFPEGGDPVLFARFSRESHSQLKGYSADESIRRMYGDELAAFYARREEGLARLEGLSQKLIEQNEHYRRHLDQEQEALKRGLAETSATKAAELEAAYSTKHSELSDREEALKRRTGELDDRNSRHVRREIRNDLKKQLNARAERFVLTRATTQKRILVHVLFGLLLSASAAIVGHTLWEGPPLPSDSSFWFYICRIVIGILGFSASILFYIRWSDYWFRQHADEEFRLKRLELDIDRASWVVEMAMEWKGDQGNEIPDELVERLTRGLFTDHERVTSPRHPGEDIASALFDSIKSLRMAIPGVGEAELDRPALQRLRKRAPHQPSA